MYIPAAIFKNGHHLGQRSNLRICYCFFVILGPKNVYLDTMVFFPSDLETEILIHVCSGGHFEKCTCLIMIS